MPILYGAGPEGRTDAFRLDLIPPESVPVPTTNPAYRLPKNPTSGTFRNIVSTPVRSAIGYKKDGNPVLYVAGGELDRVQIFFLGPDGGIQPDRHIDEPQDIDQSYPNDVVFKDITGCD